MPGTQRNDPRAESTLGPHPAEVAAIAQLSEVRLRDGPDAESGRKTGAPDSTWQHSDHSEDGIENIPKLHLDPLGLLGGDDCLDPLFFFKPIFRSPRCIESESGVALLPC